MKTISIFLIAMLTGAGALFGNSFALDPKASFVMGDIPGMTTVGSNSMLPDSADAPLWIAVTPGTTILLQALGDICLAGTDPSGTVLAPCFGVGSPGPSPEMAVPIGGVFTQDQTLLDTSNLLRLPTAVSSGLADFTDPTYTTLYYHNTVSVVNPLDFLIPTGPGVTVIVPGNAHWLAVGVFDSFYHDNSDPNNDLAVQAT